MQYWWGKTLSCLGICGNRSEAPVRSISRSESLFTSSSLPILKSILSFSNRSIASHIELDHRLWYASVANNLRSAVATHKSKTGDQRRSLLRVTQTRWANRTQLFLQNAVNIATTWDSSAICFCSWAWFSVYNKYMTTDTAYTSIVVSPPPPVIFCQNWVQWITSLWVSYLLLLFLVFPFNLNNCKVQQVSYTIDTQIHSWLLRPLSPLSSFPWSLPNIHHAVVLYILYANSSL